MGKNVAKTSINTIRMLGIEAITNAKSGHGGIVLGAAPIMYALFHDHINIDLENLSYFNRDRFILSSGHGSALLYATMLVFGYPSITINDLKQFRQLHSKTPGHPENYKLEGVEICTGPLGQGCGMSVGFAIAESHLAGIYNKYSPVIDHYTYVMLGDGDLEEGIAQEAMAVAGKNKLSKLIWLYDSNNIQLDGKVSDSNSWNIKALCQAYSWNYIYVANSDYEQISKAIAAAKTSTAPTLIEVKTIIGDGWKLTEGTNKSHGLTLDANGVIELKKSLDYKYDDFSIPEEVKQDFKVVSIRSKQAVKKYNDAVAKLSKSDKTLYTSFDSVAKQNFAFELSWFEQIPFVPKEATRTLFGQVFDIFFKHHPTFMAINPDISSSTKIKSGSIYGDTNQIGQTVNVGVREFIAADIVNGLTAHGGIRAASSTFLSFSDYNKQAIRLGAISNLPILNVFSHDTITVGEDGPTHQPIEQIPSLRLIPNHYLFRPCNTEECIATLKFLNSKNKPTTAITSRSAFTQIKSKVADALMGGYVVQDDKNYDLTIIATGSEIETAINVISELKKVNKNARLVSMPCVRLFKEQSSAYQQKVLGNKPIVSIEFAATAPWYELVDLAIGIDTFGASGKPNDLISEFKLQPKDIVKKILTLLKK